MHFGYIMGKDGVARRAVFFRSYGFFFFGIMYRQTEGYNRGLWKCLWGYTF